MKRLAPLAAFVLAACVSPGMSATPGLGQVGLVDGLRIRPLAIVEDSRCPIDAVCVWAGRLVVRTEIRGSGWREVRDLELRKPIPIAGGQLALIEAAPSKMADRQVEPRSYRFTFNYENGR